MLREEAEGGGVAAVEKCCTSNPPPAFATLPSTSLSSSTSNPLSLTSSMGKSIRSKVMKRNRTYLRKTIGVAADEIAFKETQAVTKAVLDIGTGSSIEKLGNIFGGAHALAEEHVMNDEDEEEGDGAGMVSKKDSVVKTTKRNAKVHMTGTPGAHRARLQVSKTNKRHQTKKGYNTKKVKPTKKRGGAAKF